MALIPIPLVQQPTLTVLVVAEAPEGQACPLHFAGAADGDEQELAIGIGRQFDSMHLGLLVADERAQAVSRDPFIEFFSFGKAEAVGGSWSFRLAHRLLTSA